MIQYIYFVKCPNCEAEPFDFFNDAKTHALGCLSQKPIITQTEFDRDDYGVCVDTRDLGTVWSWEDEATVTADEPAVSIFTKDDLVNYDPDHDPEFDALDNSLEVDSDDFRKPVPADMSVESLVEEMEENEDMVECKWCEDLFDKSECRYEVDLGYLCSRCQAAIMSRGETLTFRENNYWDFLDEEVSTDDLTNDDVDPMIKNIVATHKMCRIDFEQQIDERNRQAAKTGRCPVCGGTLTDMVCDHCHNSYRQNGNHGSNLRLVDAALVKSIEKLDPSFKGLSLDQKVEYIYNAYFGDPNEKGTDTENRVDQENNRRRILGNSTHDTSAERVRAVKQQIKQDLLLIDKRKTELDDALSKIKPEEYLNHKVVVKESMLEELEEADVYRERLTSCQECGGATTFDSETGICINCGFNTFSSLEEDVDNPEPSLSELVRDSINSLINSSEVLPSLDRCASFAFEVAEDIRQKHNISFDKDFEAGDKWYKEVMSEVYNQLKQMHKDNYEPSSRDAFFKKKYELDYPEIEVTMQSAKRDVDDWDEWTETVEYTYEVENGDVIEYLAEIIQEEDVTDIDGGLKALESLPEEDYWAYFIINFYDLTEKYEQEILDYWKDSAVEAAQQEASEGRFDD